MKEKLSFVEQENNQLEEKVKQIDSKLSGRRDELAGLKAARDRLRTRAEALKAGSTFVSDPALLADMQVCCAAPLQQWPDDLPAAVSCMWVAQALVQLSLTAACMLTFIHLQAQIERREDLRSMIAELKQQHAAAKARTSSLAGGVRESTATSVLHSAHFADC